MIPGLKLGIVSKASAKGKVGILEKHRNKPWFDQECLELSNKRKQAKLR